jgi:hypothetical protein
MMIESLRQPKEHLTALPTDGTAGSQENIIGQSKERRSIYCLTRGHSTAPLKVLVLAGQHGDERPARRSVESLLAEPPESLASRFPHLQLAVIPDANPDGYAVKSRFNADGIDLNRDHQLLRSMETMAVHQFVRLWQPQVMLDLHSYPSRRRHLLARNVVLNHDVFIDVPSHPAILARPGSPAADKVLRGLLQALSAKEVKAERYTIVEASGRVRHSTPDVTDARNGLALRYGVFTLLIENRQPRREETPSERRHLHVVQELALWTILDWLDLNHTLFLPSFAQEPPVPGSPVPVRFKYQHHWKGFNLLCREADQEQPVSVNFSRYCGSLAIRRSVPLPFGYAVPPEFEALRAVLHRHGFIPSPKRGGKPCVVERLRIEKTRSSRRSNRSACKIKLVPHPMRMDLDRYEVFPTQQNGGEALAVFLEPESKHGLHRFAGLQLPIQAPSWYPVLRVLDGTSVS